MNIFLICSTNFYNSIPKIQNELEKLGHKLSMPTCFEEPEIEERYRKLSEDEYLSWKKQILKASEEIIMDNDAVLVINLEKSGIESYIGGATFLEMYDAFRLGKKIFLYNDIPKGILYDEIVGFNPIVLNGNLELIK